MDKNLTEISRRLGNFSLLESLDKNLGFIELRQGLIISGGQ